MKRDIICKENIIALKLFGIKSRTSNSYGRNLSYMRYDVVADFKGGKSFRIADIFEPEELSKLSYWSKRSGMMSMTCWGTSQLFEAQISLAKWLGFDDKDWPAFSKRATSFITQIN